MTFPQVIGSIVDREEIIFFAPPDPELVPARCNHQLRLMHRLGSRANLE